MAGISLLQSMLMNIEESNRWYHQLEKFAEEHSGSMKKEALSRLLYLKISLPQYWHSEHDRSAEKCRPVNS